MSEEQCKSHLQLTFKRFTISILKALLKSRVTLKSRAKLSHLAKLNNLVILNLFWFLRKYRQLVYLISNLYLRYSGLQNPPTRQRVPHEPGHPRAHRRCASLHVWPVLHLVLWACVPRLQLQRDGRGANRRRNGRKHPSFDWIVGWANFELRPQSHPRRRNRERQPRAHHQLAVTSQRNQLVNAFGRRFPQSKR